ncbi:WAP four-disulfide core domain protein 18-like [Octodon degus]|uniref:WAP four-disulfide core domain protein 18-like n=1 Tax=Octodon degus TaxID=10160 RepID=A0A6P6DFM0_OCTDE|nr:WAP four-disulfide core domain protein 18-like [Octodon degus]
MQQQNKPGACPEVSAGSYGRCDDHCSGDESCPNNMKCCNNGCGHACIVPVF